MIVRRKLLLFLPEAQTTNNYQPHSNATLISSVLIQERVPRSTRPGTCIDTRRALGRSRSVYPRCIIKYPDSLQSGRSPLGTTRTLPAYLSARTSILVLTTQAMVRCVRCGKERPIPLALSAFCVMISRPVCTWSSHLT